MRACTRKQSRSDERIRRQQEHGLQQQQRQQQKAKGHQRKQNANHNRNAKNYIKDTNKKGTFSTIADYQKRCQQEERTEVRQQQ